MNRHIQTIAVTAVALLALSVNARAAGRGTAESVAARAVLRRSAAGGALEVSRRRPARPAILRAGPDAHRAHGHQLAAPVHACDTPAADPAQPGARARVARSPRRAP